MFDVVQAVKEGKARFEWDEVCSEHEGKKLYISVFRDAMKFDNVPAMTWKREEVPEGHPDHGTYYDGVRVPAQAKELQEIADYLQCMLMTPTVIDMLWLQAKIKFNAVLNTPYPSSSSPTIVATSDIHRVHQEIEKKIESVGGDPGYGLISCVGKYWCLINALTSKGLVDGSEAACNYGWCTTSSSAGPGLTPGVYCYQRPGYRHNKEHWDPSQTIRLMYRWARLIHEDGTQERVDLHEIAANADLAPLIHHEKTTLNYLRQSGVPEPEAVMSDGVLVMPEVAIYSNMPPADMNPVELKRFLSKEQTRASTMV